MVVGIGVRTPMRIAPQKWQASLSFNVLNKFKKVKKIILATVDKSNFEVIEIFEVDPIKTIKILEEKLQKKQQKYAKMGGLRRLQVSLTLNEVSRIGAKLVFKK